jgi:Elongation factor Tu GTP binding domain
VKARGDRRRARSDWMVVERERGISVSSAVMSFEHAGLAFNLLDTPGHQDFSPLGFQRGHYHTLTALPPPFPPPLAGRVSPLRTECLHLVSRFVRREQE